MANTEMNYTELLRPSGFYDEFTAATSSDPNVYPYTKDIGFIPETVFFYFIQANGALVFKYDVENNKVYRTYNSWDLDMTSDFYPNYIKVEGSTIYYKAYASGFARQTAVIAI